MFERLFRGPRRWPLLAGLSVLGVLGAVLLLPGGLILSASGADMSGQYVAWRAFAAESLRAGHFPLWNPYTYAGEPFLGDFQSALLYPPNAIFLFLPMARALNLSMLLHLLLLGWGMGFWAVRRGLHPGAAALGGVVAMLCGPVLPHLYAGHLSNLCSLAWAPWILCALEIAWRGKNYRALLCAAGAVCLQILAGNVQYVFYTGIAAGLFAVVASVAEPAARRRALPMVAGAYGFAAALAAAQLLPGYAAAAEGVRQGKLEYEFVRMFSFPPENLLTFLAPWFFGNFTTAVYWGRAYLWEVSLFAGVSGLALGLVALADPSNRRQVRMDFILMVLLFILALGDYTPLLRILYDYAPGFGQFRGLSKFTFPALLFGMLVLASGADALIRRRPVPRGVGIALAGIGGLAGLAGIYLRVKPEAIGRLLAYIGEAHESYLPVADYTNRQFAALAGAGAGLALAVGGVILCVMGVALALTQRWSALRWLPLAALPVEMLVFARASTATMSVDGAMPPALAAVVAKQPGDYRVFCPPFANNGFLLGAPDIWGVNPSVLKRYAEFMAFTQGGDATHPGQYVAFREVHPLFAMLRLQYAFLPGPSGLSAVAYKGALPRALLVSDFRVLPGRDAIFSAMGARDFDPRKTVLLESGPSVRPQPGGEAGQVHVLDSTSDSLTLEADVPAPALLLVTDLYSRDWRVRALPGSAQPAYEVMPANYILRAVPLPAGHHVLCFEYMPSLFQAGLVISAVSWLAWVAGMVMLGRRLRHETSP